MTEIYDLSQQCKSVFLGMLSVPNAKSIPVIEVLYNEFEQWASYLGVFAHPSTSLDSRLMHSDSLRNLVLQLLQISKRNIERVVELERQKPNELHGTSPSSIVEQMESRNASSISSPLIESLQALEAAVQSLHRLGLAIRQSSSTDLTQRISSFIEKNDDGSMEGLFLFQLKNRWIDRPRREGKPGASLSLCKQLAVSVAFRYFGVHYRRNHQQKLETPRKVPPVAEALYAAGQKDLKMPEKQPGPAIHKPIPQRINQLSCDVSASAPTIPDSKQALQKYASFPASTTGGTSVVSVQLRDAKYPDIPPATSTACPYCAQKLATSAIKNKRAWERHVDNDLKLYVCISEECVEPPQLFARFEDWTAHMEDEHSSRWAEEIHQPSVWCCDTDHDEEYFDDQAAFDEHVKSQHPDYVAEDEIAELKEWCEIKRPRPPYTCPICNCIPEDVALIAPWLTQDPTSMTTSPGQPCQTGSDLEAGLRSRLARHVASHLKDIGFMSIIYLDDGEDGSQASRVASGGADEYRITPDEGAEPTNTHALDQDFPDYKIPRPPTPLNEQLFELDWNHVKDFSPSLRRQDTAVDDLDGDIQATVRDVQAMSPDDTHWPEYIGHLLRLFRTRHERLGALEDLDRPTEILQTALDSMPENHPNRAGCLRDLGRLWFQRFQKTSSVPDLDSAIRKMELAADSIANGPDQVDKLSVLGEYLRLRFMKLQSIADLDLAIHYSQDAITGTSRSHPHYSHRKCSLGAMLFSRLMKSKSPDDLDHAIQAVQDARTAIASHNPSSDPRLLFGLGNVLRMQYQMTGDVMALDDAISATSDAIKAAPTGQSNSAAWLLDLSRLYVESFYRTGRMEDLDRAIHGARRACDTASRDSPGLSQGLHHLGELLGIRFNRTGSRKDLDSQLVAYKASVACNAAPPSICVLCILAILDVFASQGNWEPQQEMLWQAAAEVHMVKSWPLKSSYGGNLLITRSDVASKVTAAALNMGLTAEDALGLFELALCNHSATLVGASGQSLSQLYPDLSEEFKSLRNKLDTPEEDPNIFLPKDDASWVSEATGGFDVRRALTEVIDKIRAKPGFENFLNTLEVAEIRDAASPGPIIIINVDSYRCDAFFVERHRIRVLPLPELTVEGIEEILERTLHNPLAPIGLDSLTPTGLDSLLHWLWETICRPCLDALGFDRAIETGDGYPSVWWIPTGPLDQMPLHAAGIHTQSSPDTVIDRVASSFAPSINALIQGRRHSLPRDGGEIFLAGGKPQSTFDTKHSEIFPGFCQSLKLSSTRAMPYSLDGLGYLDRCTIFLYEGPLTSAFKEPLRSRRFLDHGYFTIGAGQFTLKQLRDNCLQVNPPFLVFLSNSFWPGEYPPRISLRVFMKIQQAGFRHVVGQLWSVQQSVHDTVMQEIYKTLEEEGLTDGAVGRGLHRAQRAVRDANMGQGGGIKDPSQPRFYWVPYVHYGV
ncbi:hypothetical protein FDECE_13547 [Fusarium decemcellulare]|nr:hypothetical protein FDECE_13547 [Fusarium decemcellulare]